MPREYLTVVTRKGQITIPAEMRQALGISEGDRVALILEDDHEVRLALSQSAVARTAGMLKSEQPPLSAEELRTAGEEAMAASAAERDGRS